MNKTFHSNGKLLLTAEYVVLDGASALAIPTKYGQSLEVLPSQEKGIQWKSLDEKGQVWFEEHFNWNFLEPAANGNKYSETLSKILREARKLNPDFLLDNEAITVKTKLDFPRNWGLGTSSTLINNIAQWADVDAFSLLTRSFGGSGYDIAAAQTNQPIVYQLQDNIPLYKSVNLHWNFTDSLFFVHLNQKQDSRDGIERYRNVGIQKTTIETISKLTLLLLQCESLLEFEGLLTLHEKIISELIELPTVKETLFADYPKSIKSLGAWGGDFILATGGVSEMAYFKQRGYNTIVSFREMIR